jgi:EAL domain-containing protein (putative c-di-GMP-specific phosphodiesterase class I)
MNKSYVLVVDGKRVAEELAAAGLDVLACHDAAAAKAIASRVPIAAVVAKRRIATIDAPHVAPSEATSKLHNIQGTGTLYRVPSLDAILGGVNLIPYFQPIVNLQHPDAPPYGYESLARFRGNIPFCSCEFLFDYAKQLGRIADLELACIRQTLRWGAPLAQRGKLFLNLHPHVFNRGPELVETILTECARNNVPASNLVLEITEQDRLLDENAAVAASAQLRAAGVQFALDDVGMSYSHLSIIDGIKPSYLKVSQHFGTRFETNGSKQKIIRNIIALAADFDCEVVIEGIEESATSGAAAAIGARFGQGFLYSRPLDAAAFS